MTMAVVQDWPSMGWTREEVIAATAARPGTAAGAATAAVFDAVSTDSRQVSAGALFVALRGVHHDGHRFAAAALSSGAKAALVERVPVGIDPARALVVDDTLRALGDLAAWTRRRNPLQVVGITGSNGKTTTKEMVAAICARADFPGPRGAVLKTRGNENNLVGLPLTLLRLAGDEAVAVLEMGMNAPGEIARLTEIAAPDVGVITNVSPVHLEGVGSVAGVAAAKAELFAGMRPNATIVVNADDEWAVRAASDYPGRRIEFGRGREVEARAVRDTSFDGVVFALGVAGRTATVRLRMAGRHNVGNALAGAAVAHGLGIDVEAIAAGLGEATAPPMRMQVLHLANGTTVVNDAYNANPASMDAALRAIVRMPGRPWAVLGEMRELGKESSGLHYCLGRQAAACGIQVLVAVGPQAEAIAAGARAEKPHGLAIHLCPGAAAAAQLIAQLWQPGDAILVKGSRGADSEDAVRLHGARMAEVVHLLQKAAGGD